MSFVVVIPARFLSNRLPGKLLIDVAGKPLLQYVHEQAKKSSAGRVIIATDDQKICDTAEKFGASVCLTATHHQSGTERIAEVVTLENFPDDTIVVNVQGDEPLIPPALIDQVAEELENHPDASIATLCYPIAETASIFDPDIVKVVCDYNQYALYFSRSPIPWDREQFGGVQLSKKTPLLNEPAIENLSTSGYFHHVGIYAYRAHYLKQHVKLPPSPLEVVERLEQLRALHHGYKIHVSVAQSDPGIGVDTEEDLQRMRQMLGQ